MFVSYDTLHLVGALLQCHEAFVKPGVAVG